MSYFSFHKAKSAVAKKCSSLSRRKPVPTRLLKKPAARGGVSNLTQSSPPPPQLKTNTKQSSIVAFFGQNAAKSRGMC